MKTLLLSLIVSLTNLSLFASDGTITGQVKDSITNEAIVGANVALISNGKIIQGTATDVDGYYTIKNLVAGEYNIRVSFVGMSTRDFNGIRVFSDQATTLNVGLTPNTLDMIIVQDVGVDEKIDMGFNGGGSERLPASFLEKMAIRPEQAASIVAGAYQEDYNAPITFRGSRVGTTLYMVDGMRIIGEPSMPLNSIEEEMVFEGGIPAKYGDTVGGVIVINTKSFHFY